MFDTYDEYQEQLLQAQFNISEIIDHKLTRGEIREDFLKKLLSDRIGLNVVRNGFVCNNTKQSSQCDIILQSHGTQIRSLGAHSLVDIEDCGLVMEVKSNATSKDFRKFNSTAGEIKTYGLNTPLCGVFCYRISVSKNSIVKQFGYNYDETIDSYLPDLFLPLSYPNIDFVLSIHASTDDNGVSVIQKFFIVRRSPPEQGKTEYLLYNDQPILKNFFDMLKTVK